MLKTLLWIHASMIFYIALLLFFLGMGGPWNYKNYHLNLKDLKLFLEQAKYQHIISCE